MDVSRAHSIAIRAVYEHYALQKVHELTFLLSLLEKDDVVVEIGCDAGGTSWGIKEMGVRRHIGVDLPGEEFSSGLAWQGSGEMVWGDSHRKQTKERLIEILDEDEISVLIIDGDHTYGGVADDWRMYRPLTTGLVIFHDIVYHQHMPDVQVHRFYGEMKSRYPHAEYISEHDDSWGGIGVIDLSYSKRLVNALQQV